MPGLASRFALATCAHVSERTFRLRLTKTQGKKPITQAKERGITSCLFVRPRFFDNGITMNQGRLVDEMLSLSYLELRDLARAFLKSERPNHALQPTALVHEVYFKLLGQQKIELELS